MSPEIPPLQAFRTMSIRKTIGLSVLVMSTVMLVVFAIMGLKARNTLLEHELAAMHGQWATLAESTIPALLFDDEQAAVQLLNSLKASPKLVAAALLHPSGRELAHYGEDIPDASQLGEQQFVENLLIINKAIMFEGVQVGVLLLAANMGEFRALEKRLLLILLLLMGFALSIALLVFQFLQQRVAKPLAHFAATADDIARSGDYSRRIEVRSGDELYTFARGFNTMLETVQQRDRELLNHKNHLEDMVSARTADLEHAKDAAEAASRAKSAFLANMSHELRTPLNAVLGYAQILQRDSQLGDLQQQNIATIKRSGEYLLTLINDILDLAKIEAGRLELHNGPCQLAQFFSDLSELFRLRAIDKNIAFSYQSTDSLPSIVSIDAKRLRQIGMNLLGNAVKFTEHGEVCLKTDYRNGTLLIHVSDTGIGISPEVREEIFKPFRQAGDDQYKQQGTGLGLAISQSLVEHMQGYLEFDSQIGIGSTFSVYIPASPLDIDAMTTVSPLRATGYQRTDGNPAALQILVADDNQDNREVLKGLLTPLGFVISEAVDGEEAVALSAAQAYDLILMDLVMPKRDGLSATRHIMARDSRVKHKIIAISARAFAENCAESLAAGCCAHLSKPVDGELLQHTLGEHLPLTWLYAKVEQPTTVVTEPTIINISAEWLSSLEQAVLDGDRNQALALLGSLRQQDERLADKLEAWIKGYESKRILEWITTRSG